LFWVFFFAHLLGDYILQPDWLVRERRKQWGMLLHAGTHFVVLVLVVGPSRATLWPYLALLATVHFLIDRLKLTILLPRLGDEAQAYLLDSVLHLATLGLAAAWLSRTQTVEPLQVSTRWYVVGSGYLLATYVWYILERLFLGGSGDFRGKLTGQAVGRMFVRAALVTILLAAASRIRGIAILSFVLPYQNPGSRLREWITDIIVAAASASLVILGTA
jgi:hypothetical protein